MNGLPVSKGMGFVRTLCLIALSAAWAFSGCAEKGYVVSGRVMDAEGKPIEAAVVRVEPDLSGASRADGTFEIQGVQTGSRKLTAARSGADGNFTQSEFWIVVAGDTSVGELTLPAPPTLSEPVLSPGLWSSTVLLSWTPFTSETFREYQLYKGKTTGLDRDTGELLHVSTDITDHTYAEELPYDETATYRVFVMDERGLVAGSNIVRVAPGPWQHDPVLPIGEERITRVSPAAPVTFVVDVEPGRWYAVTWFDHWFDGYSALGVEVKAVEPESGTQWFRSRLIQMDGRPRLIRPQSERVRIDAYSEYHDPAPGTLGIRVDEVPFFDAQNGGSFDSTVEPGGFLGVRFPIEVGGNYELKVNALGAVGAEGDAIQVGVSCGWSNGGTACDLEALANLSLALSAPAGSDALDVVLSGAWWWDPNPVEILLTPKP